MKSITKAATHIRDFAVKTRSGVMGLITLFSTAYVSAQTAPAGGSLPALEAPSRGTEGGLIRTLQNYAFDFAILVGLIIATVAFYVVANAAVATFNEARVRGEWSKFAVVVVVGVVLIVCIIWLATRAAAIL